MQSLIEALRTVIGNTSDWYVKFNPTSNSYSWDYGAMFEYFVAAMLLIIVVSSVFKILVNLFKRS